MNISPVTYWILAALLPIVAALFVYVATLSFWGNSPFRSQNAYDRWFVSGMENALLDFNSVESVEVEVWGAESSSKYVIGSETALTQQIYGFDAPLPFSVLGND